MTGEPPNGGKVDPTHVDAEVFLRISERLREAFAEVADADLTPGQKRRWQQRLIEITNTAKLDLGQAEEQLRRFAADWRRAR